MQLQCSFLVSEVTHSSPSVFSNNHLFSAISFPLFVLLAPLQMGALVVRSLNKDHSFLRKGYHEHPTAKIHQVLNLL